MPLDLPLYVYLTFYLATALTCFLFFKAVQFNKKVIAVVLVFLIAQGILGYTEFYLNLEARPPRFIFLVPPAILFIILLFVLRKGRDFLDRFSQKWLTFVHVIRIPIELCLYWLFLGGFIPEIMTFSGQNFDIIAGLTAPLIYSFGFAKNRLSRRFILVWNITCFGLLMNIVVTALLAAPLPFQQICFDQPNVGILYFPFLWLAGLIVPLVMLAHLISIRHYLKSS